MRSFMVVVMLGVMLGCGGGDGDSCDPQKYLGSCVDRVTSLVCDDGVTRMLPCRGPRGCAVNNSSLICDNSVVQEGDACPSSAKGYSGCSVSKTILTCDGSVEKKTMDCATTCIYDGSSGAPVAVCR